MSQTKAQLIEGLNVNTSAPADSLVIDSSGNVGIGTTSPANTLHIAGSSANLRIEDTDTNAYSIINTDNGGSLYLSADAANSQASSSVRLLVDGTEHVRLDSSGNLKFDSGYGSVATAYGCRAWVNFNGTGTVAIRESGNVSSITDRGTGAYTVNFTTSMPDSNYSVGGSAGRLNDISDSNIDIRALNTGSLLFNTRNQTVAALVDRDIILIQIFR